MARETIFPSTPPRRLVVMEGQPPSEDMDWRQCPQVIWTRGKDVQIGIVPEHRPEAHDDDRMYTGTLDRAQINQLIAVLRRARNAAYGEDA